VAKAATLFRDAPASLLPTALHSWITFQYHMGLSHMRVGVHAYMLISFLAL